MKLRSDGFLHRRAMPTRYAFGRHRFYPQELAEHERFELSDNVSPHLAWDDVPEGTRSLVITCVDHDAPSDVSLANERGERVSREMPRTDFVHWVLIDIPADHRELEEGQFSSGVTVGGKSLTDVPDGMRHGLNDYTRWFADDAEMQGRYFGYDGPCPPWNDDLIHWYEFQLFATDVETLEVPDGFDLATVQRALAGRVLAQASLEGFYYIPPEARFR